METINIGLSKKEKIFCIFAFAMGSLGMLYYGSVLFRAIAPPQRLLTVILQESGLGFGLLGAGPEAFLIVGIFIMLSLLSSPLIFLLSALALAQNSRKLLRATNFLINILLPFAFLLLIYEILEMVSSFPNALYAFILLFPGSPFTPLSFGVVGIFLFRRIISRMELPNEGMPLARNRTLFVIALLLLLPLLAPVGWNVLAGKIAREFRRSATDYNLQIRSEILSQFEAIYIPTYLPPQLQLNPIPEKHIALGPRNVYIQYASELSLYPLKIRQTPIGQAGALPGLAEYITLSDGTETLLVNIVGGDKRYQSYRLFIMNLNGVRIRIEMNHNILTGDIPKEEIIRVAESLTSICNSSVECVDVFQR